jgi:arsenate reductase
MGRMSAFFPIVVHHNPACGATRNVIAMIEDAGLRPVVVEYLHTGWTNPQLQGLIAAAGAGARKMLRANHDRATELGLLADGVTEGQLLDAMAEHPILVNRPIVATPKGVRRCRPKEKLPDLPP